MEDFFVIVIGETGDKQPKFLIDGEFWTSSLATAKRFDKKFDAENHLKEIRHTEGIQGRIEKVIHTNINK